MRFKNDVEDALHATAATKTADEREAPAQIVRDWLVGQGILEAGDDDDTDADGIAGGEN